jgi:hypothetical protein
MILDVERFIFAFPEATHGLLADFDLILMILPHLLNVLPFILRMEDNVGEIGGRVVCLVVIIGFLNPKL